MGSALDSPFSQFGQKAISKSYFQVSLSLYCLVVLGIFRLPYVMGQRFNLWESTAFLQRGDLVSITSFPQSWGIILFLNFGNAKLENWGINKCIKVFGRKGDEEKDPGHWNWVPGEKELELKSVNICGAWSETGWRKWSSENRVGWMRETEFFSGRRIRASSSYRELENWAAQGTLTRNV